MNITKLKVWPALQQLGFEPINYNFNGKKVATGATTAVLHTCFLHLQIN